MEAPHGIASSAFSMVSLRRDELLRARAVTLTGYDEVARFAGLEPAEMIARAALSPPDLHDPENWLPADKVIALIDASAASSGRDDFGILLGKCRTFTSLGPVSLLLKHEATVRGIITAIVDYSYLLNDLLNVTVKDDGSIATIEWNLVPGLRSRHLANLVAAIVYRAISEALEYSWDPDCVHFRDSAPEQVATFSRYFRCNLEFNCSFDGMSCSSTALNTRNPFADADLAAHARRLLNLLPGAGQITATRNARSAIVLLMDEGEVSIERAAECLGVEVRTLQRRLAAEATSFRQLCRDIRRELAARYLTNCSHSVTEISGILGYASASAFSNWFIKEFGISAGAYRRESRREVSLPIDEGDAR
jgi:AraC-like DNA-binding protein